MDELKFNAEEIEALRQIVGERVKANQAAAARTAREAAALKQDRERALERFEQVERARRIQREVLGG